MKITRVRFDEHESRELLEKFVFGGHYGPRRVPRGIEPALVAEFLREKTNAETDSDDFAKILDLLRFYECIEPLALLPQHLIVKPTDAESFSRQTLICQILGDFPGQPDGGKAVAHFEKVLEPHPLAVAFSSLVLDTALVLAPAGTLNPFAAALGAEVQRLAVNQQKSEEAMMAFDKASSIQTNDLPRIRRLIEAKTKVATREPAARRHELVELYLGRGPVNDGYLQVWAGRLLRQEAITGNPLPAQAEFAKTMDNIPLDLVGADKVSDVVVNRCARAFRYFGGVLTDKQKDKLARAKVGTLDFLDDGD